MITPTVGRVVHYYPPYPRDGDQPLAAIVAHVHSDRLVNLAIFNADGRPSLTPPTSIQLLQDDDKPTGSHWCAWMPYQIGQAQKTEALEKQIAGK